MSEKFSEGNGMRDVVAAVAGPREWGDTRESWLARAARRAGVTFRQSKALWYGEISDPEHRAARRMAAAAEARGRQEVGDLASRFETIARHLHAADQDFYREDVAALVDAARALRNVDRARTQTLTKD